MTRILFVSFLPFAGRVHNGSTPVAKHLVELLAKDGLDVAHATLATSWDSLPPLPYIIGTADMVVGLGEGFDTHVAMETIATRCVAKKDGKPLYDVSLWPQGKDVLEQTSWSLDETAVPPQITSPLNLQVRTPLRRGSFAGVGQCNAVFYHILALQKPGGFIHIPPMDAWMERTKEGKDAYVQAFSRAVRFILEHNNVL